jgi:hypothetical protein
MIMRKHLPFIIVFCILLSTLPSYSFAHDPTTGQEAETKAAQPTEPTEKSQATSKESLNEVAALKKAIIDLQNKSKLGFRKIVLSQEIEGFGLYSPLPQKLGASPSALMIYIEPENVSTLVSEDRWIIDCSIDLIIADSAGKIIGGQKAVSKINRVSRSPILDLFFKLQVNFSKPVKGEVLIKMVLHDRIKGQSASAVNKINIDITKPGGGI